MDERELGALFREAVSTAPPASFDEHDVARGSRRVTARRRVLASGGSLVAAALVVGGVGAGTGAFDEDRSTVASPPVQSPQVQSPRVQSQPEVITPERAPVKHGPMVESQPGSGAGIMSSPASGTMCGPADPSMTAVVTGELPAAASVPPRAATDCPHGSRAAVFRLRDGDAVGSVTVILAPASSSEQPRGESPGPGGTVQVTDRTHSGRVLVVRSEPEWGSAHAPYSGRLGAVADGLSARL